ncbi:NACHT domain-containing protein [Solirubrobacter phytolaccae]|uniref:NACHT domain-containing protein n=1 Tax=Solirubrobacter phytolaccae TaxID=1404360 RepID=A0A9X3S9V3_9ACTN|nr:NACHT domain-containing protein [Solirubrobacter phytolaccae]MDA0183799.1 NACHT domain-containing protein [Solirubrobacter phytolaccae]
MSDPLDSQILVGLFVNALHDVIKSALKSSRDLELPQDLETRIADDVKAAAKELTDVQISPELGGDRLLQFIRSAEVAAVIQQLFATGLTESLSVEQARQEFVLLMQLRVGVPDDIAATHGGRIFDSFVLATSRILQRHLTTETLAQHALMHIDLARLESRLMNLERNIALLRAQTTASMDAILSFERQLRSQIHQRDSVVIPPSLDRNVRVNVDTLYVSPLLRSPAGEDLPLETYGEFAARFHRAVVLGDPGGGKSTLTTKLTSDLSKSQLESASDTPVDPPTATPLRVVLRDYGVERKQDGHSIFQHLQRLLNTRYQFAETPPGALEYLLRNGRAILIFDGLDELLDTHQRQEISADVESFANLFPTCRILVTSRAVGYEEAPLNPSEFPVWRLVGFDDERVRAYATKWFAYDGSSGGDLEDQVDAFVSETEVVPDLRTNPLLVGLMANIYRGEGDIPANRPAIYKKCALMLFDRWDKRRGIAAPLPFQSLLRPTMQFLAHWIYTHSPLHGGVTEQALVDRTTEYLHPRRYPTDDQAREKAVEFVDLCKGRAWVFSDTGLTESDEPLFHFTHATFLEFFTAEYLVRTHEGPRDLAQALIPRIAKQEWDMVAQLAAQIQEDSAEDAADRFLETLLDWAESEGPTAGGRNVVSFVARSLAFFVPSPAVADRAADRVVRLTLEGDRGDDLRAWEATSAADPQRLNRREHLDVSEPTSIALIEDLRATSSEAAPMVATALRDAIARAIADSESRRTAARLAFDLRHLHVVPQFRSGGLSPQLLYEVLAEVLVPQIDQLAVDDLYVAAKATTHGELDVSRAIELFGHAWLLQPIGFHFASGPSWHSPVGMKLIWGRASDSAPSASLAWLGVRLRNAEPPYFARPFDGVHGGLLQWMQHSSQSVALPASIDGDERFAATMLVASMVETDSLSEAAGVPDRAAMSRLADTLGVEAAEVVERRLATLVDTRDARVAPDRAVDVSSLSDLMAAWANHELDFTHAPTNTESSSRRR